MAGHRLRRRTNKLSTSVLPLSEARNPLQPSFRDLLLPERRQPDSPRFPQAIAAKISSLTLAFDPLVVTLDAVVVNASGGGLCISTAWPLAISSCMRCELSFAEDRVRIPTLMQVRWVNTCDDNNYLCGLQYLV